MKMRDILNMDSVVFYHGLNGMEVKGIEYGKNKYVLCVSDAFFGLKIAHRVKVHHDANGTEYIKFHGYRISLAEITNEINRVSATKK